MVLEQEIQPYSVWFPQALKHFGETAFFVILGALAVSYLVAAFRYGPLAAGDRLYRALLGAAKDLISIAPRRVWALARLSIHEAIRRRVWVALVAFGVVLMFAGWFLDPTSPEPGPLYLRFVMSATTYLVLLMALLISTFSLPADMKNRTITTVVTKPVHTSEIVLGRIVGFSIVGTVLLALMALCSYVFVARALNHTHEIVAEDINESALEPGHLKPGRVGTTKMAQNHQHDVLLREDGVLETDFKFGHKHYIRTEKVDGKTRYICESPEDLLTARVPLLGKLHFLDRDGQPKEKGINVGHEWDYRGFVDGQHKSAAIWTFDNIDEDKLFPNIPVGGTQTAAGNEHSRVSHLQGRHRKGHSGKVVFAKSGNQVGKRTVYFPRQGIHDRKPLYSPQTGSREPCEGRCRKSICSRIWCTTAKWKSCCNAWNRANCWAWRRPICTFAPTTPTSR